MNTPRLGPTLAAASRESRMPFNLVVAYEDQPTRHRALHLTHHLSSQFVDDYEFRCSWWKFDHLANEILRDQAAHAASEANMIVLALNARPRLTALQSDWMQTWLELRLDKRALGGQTGALVALLATPEPASACVEQAVAQLRPLAASAQLDFFFHAFELPKTDAGRSAQPELNPAPASVTTDRIQLKMPIPRWGINE